MKLSHQQGDNQREVQLLEGIRAQQGSAHHHGAQGQVDAKVFIRADLFGVKGFPVGVFWLIGFFVFAALILLLYQQIAA